MKKKIQLSYAKVCQFPCLTTYTNFIKNNLEFKTITDVNVFLYDIYVTDTTVSIQKLSFIL